MSPARRSHLAIQLSRAVHYDVRVVYGGEEALGVASRYRPDVVILDVNMPGMDGLQAARQLKSDRRLRRTPFIAHCSGGAAVRRVAAEIGFRRLVVKGSQALADTLDALREILQARAFERPTRKDE